MRKFIALALCALMAFVLIACQNSDNQSAAAEDKTAENITYNGTTVFRFPEGTVLCGFDLSGKLGNTAYDLISEAAENYALTVRINEDIVVIPGNEMSLTYHEDAVTDYINAIKNGEDPSGISPITYNAKQLQSRIAYCVNTMPESVSIAYDADANSFVFTNPAPGIVYDLEPVIAELDSVITSFTPGHSTTAAPSRSTDAVISDSATRALDAANSMLRVALTYSYTPSGSRTTYEALTIDDIGSFISIDSDLKASVNKEAVLAYAEQMTDRFSVGANDGKFLTSHGEYIDFKITYADQQIDTEALAEDIIYCIENGVSGVRTATYLRKGKGWTHDFGGSYVEIDLTAQRLWVYKNYECKLYTPIVTGNLSEEWDTPTGIYKVYQHIYPTRPGRVFRYWLPFVGAYGLHDANWRSEFNSEEYLFEGSHGCVNIPPENFRIVYDYVDIGTPVIIYGGANKGAPVTQVLTGPNSYDVGVDVKNFTLDVTAKYGTTKDLTFTSDNPDVVTVSNGGYVKVRKTGTANITIESYDWSFCHSVKKVVTVNVHEDCSDVGHMIVNWTQTTAPTCTTTGVETGTCTSCDYTETRTIDVVHDFDFPAYMHPQSWITTQFPTCSEAGEKHRTCQDCGYTETESIPVEDHVPVCWRITKNATETAPGEMIAKCHFCDKEIIKEIPALS